MTDVAEIQTRYIYTVDGVGYPVFQCIISVDDPYPPRFAVAMNLLDAAADENGFALINDVGNRYQYSFIDRIEYVITDKVK